MVKTQHPWQVGPTELIEFALEHMHKASDFDRRLGFLVLDVGVETLIKTVLILPDTATGAKTSFSVRNKAVQEGFHSLIHALKEAFPESSKLIDLDHVQFYHGIRNTLYHEGSTVATVSQSQLQGYAKLAVQMLNVYLKVDLSEKLMPPEPVITNADDPVVDSVEVEVSFGRFRIERLKSQSIRAFSITTNSYETPVKPFLRAVVDELSLPIDFTLKNGVEKNTRTLGKDVIDELKPSAWHGLVPGQKIKREALVALLTGRLRDGGANPKKWEMVDIIRTLPHETLVFQPTGKGIGNSPFNIYCWWTESGKAIKKD